MGYIHVSRVLLTSGFLIRTPMVSSKHPPRSPERLFLSLVIWSIWYFSDFISNQWTKSLTLSQTLVTWSNTVLQEAKSKRIVPGSCPVCTYQLHIMFIEWSQNNICIIKEQNHDINLDLSHSGGKNHLDPWRTRFLMTNLDETRGPFRSIQKHPESWVSEHFDQKWRF